MSKIVLVTGSSRGIGKRIAIEFAKGDNIVIVNFNKSKENAVGVIKEIENSGGKADIFQADISNHDSVKKMIEYVAEKYSRIDVLINNAAICIHKSILKMPLDAWEEVIGTNLNGAFFVLKECAYAMFKQKEGAIINIASISGIQGAVGDANYSSAKAGLIALTKSAAKELGRFNIRVNTVLPGFHLTDMGKSASPEYIEKIKQESVLGLTTDINELSKFVVFLSETKTVSGQIFNFDSRLI